jgi:radical SAM protein with 4Fe4S-binding SPASM domain
MSLPQTASLTVTNHCNLRCRMCGQWSEEGYIRGNTDRLRGEMALVDWKRIVDELAADGVREVCVRGGEPFMFPGIVELLEHIRASGLYAFIDTNATLLSRFADDIVRIGGMHLTVSVDGPEAVHDEVRGVPGTFARLRDGLVRLATAGRDAAAPGATAGPITVSMCFTISRYNYRYLGSMPDVARSLGIESIAIVPYYYFPEATGRAYERELAGLGCSDALSWRGFHHEESGVDANELIAQLRRYEATLGEVRSYPYMPLTEDDYRAWFAGPEIPVGPQYCLNVERQIDVQPDGSVNFCVDFIDYSFGSVRESSIERLWNGERAERFRAHRRRRPLAVCYRCGAKYMSMPWNDYTPVIE